MPEESVMHQAMETWAKTVSNECLLIAQAHYNWLEDMNKLTEFYSIGERLDAKDVFLDTVDRHIAYFNTLIEKPTHPGRTYFYEDEARAIIDKLELAKRAVNIGHRPDMVLKNLRNALYNIGVDRAVECQIGKPKPLITHSRRK